MFGLGTLSSVLTKNTGENDEDKCCVGRNFRDIYVQQQDGAFRLCDATDLLFIRYGRGRYGTGQLAAELKDPESRWSGLNSRRGAILL